MSWPGLPANIEKRIIPEPMSGCWLWAGGFRDKKDGYGGLKYNGKMYRTHRFVFEFFNGIVPAHLAIDHLCRNKSCCNPEHLEACTWKQNIHRGEGVAPKNLAKGFCPQGHPYSVENTYVWANQRFCRTCSKGYKDRYNERKRVQRTLWDEHL